MRILACTCLLLLVTACGGGGGGSSAPAPVVPPRSGAPGHVDAAFAQGGMFVFPSAQLPDSYTLADSAAQLESGKLLLGGAYTNGRVDPYTLRTGLLVRLLPDGTLDRSLLGTGYLQMTGSLVESVIATRLIPLSGDRAVWAHFTSRVCRATRCPPPDPETDHFYARRIDASGIVESTYGTFGTAVGHLRPHDAAASPDGAMVVFGHRILPAPAFQSREVVAFDRDGVALETARLPTPPPESCALKEVGTLTTAARQADGKSLALWVQPQPSGSEICLVRVDAAGVPDASFGSGGISVLRGIAGADSPAAILPRRDGGSIGVFNAAVGGSYEPLLVWFDSAGNLDTGRGDGGVRRKLGSGIGAVAAVLLQPDGKILAAGNPDPAIAGAALPADVARIARLDPDGRVDASFGPTGQGVASLAVAGRAMHPKHILVAADWSIFVTGTTGRACGIPPEPCEARSMAMVKLRGGER